MLTGQTHTTRLARHISQLNHSLEWRLTIKIMSSNLAGLQEETELLYKRCEEVIEILKQAWTQDEIDFKGDIYQFKMPSDPVKPYQQNGGPLLYFGGISPRSKDVCAKHCDVFLMWPEPEENIYATMQEIGRAHV